jgi:abequosyltransferase
MDQNKEKILLSICIPTYNRGEILYKTLEAYVNDPEFDERIEIVISDNCSSDNTQVICQKYVAKYSNIFYYRNDLNITDRNFAKVLSLGKGLYLKLMNDTISMKKGTLKSIINILSLEKNEMKPTFFYQNINFLHSNEIVLCSNLNELVSNVSFYIGWIANFGIWRKDLESIENKDRLTHLQFTVVDLTIRIITRNTYNTIHFADYYNVADLNSKGGYNVFQTFGIKYLSLYEEYLKVGKLRKKTYNTEKYRLFRYFLIPWFQILVIQKDKRFVFNKENAVKILLENYRYNPYFYLGLTFLYLRHFCPRNNSN